MGIRTRRRRMAAAAVAALLIRAVAAGCGQETMREPEAECRVWSHGDVAPTKDDPHPTPVYFCSDP